jgi:error-prone DNA polymerase
VPYAELHCHSDFSFLDGASDPESLIESGPARLVALAITDMTAMRHPVRRGGPGSS